MGDEGRQATDETVQYLKDKLEERVGETGEPYVGVLGFSQGARAAAGLVLQQQQREKRRAGGDTEGLDSSFDFKFAIFLMATTPPLSSHPAPPGEAELISLPCLHVVGLQDPWRYSGRQLFAEHFDQSVSTLMELKVDHRLPSVESDSLKIAKEMERLYSETKGYSWSP